MISLSPIQATAALWAINHLNDFNQRNGGGKTPISVRRTGGKRLLVLTSATHTDGYAFIDSLRSWAYSQARADDKMKTRRAFRTLRSLETLVTEELLT